MPLDPLEVTGGLAIGVGVGGAISAVVEPKLQSTKNKAWSGSPNVPLSAHEVAELMAQASDSPYASYVEALNTGYEQERVDALVFLASTAPGTPEALYLWRRELISEAQARTAIQKSGLLPDYVDAVLDLFSERISPELIAVMVQRGIVANPGLLPVGPPTTTGAVPPMPQVDIDPVLEAQAHGIDQDRLAALARIVGLPASPDLAARMVFRSIIERVDFDRAISEGNTRNEWAPFLYEGFREILTAHDYAELELRGYYDRDTRLANTAKHGMSDADSDLLFDVLGRSIAVHAITTGLARGGTFDGPTDGIPDEYLQALQRGNLRPEYYNLGYANRYSYPSAFFIRLMLEGGQMTAAQGEQVFLDIGWPPDLAKLIADGIAGVTSTGSKQETKAELEDEYAGGYITAAEYQTQLEALGYSGAALTAELELGEARRLKRYREKAEDAIEAAYTSWAIDAPTATSQLAQLGITGDTVTKLLDVWNITRTVQVSGLTKAQVRAAYKKGELAEADALTRLEDLHMTAADAQDYLGE